MPDIIERPALLGSIKHAFETSKEFKDADFSNQLTEAKLKLAELMAAIAEVKLLAVEFESMVQVRNIRIAELQIRKSRRGIRGRRKRVVAA